MDIYTFKPLYKSVIWGGDKIADFKHTEIEAANVGESWELSSVPGFESVVDEGCADAGLTINQLIDKYGERLLGTAVHKPGNNTFPLLVKVIDAERDLSVQVHPNDDLARVRHNSPGKSEMWYILDSAAGAKIFCGLSAPLTPETYRQCVNNSSIIDFVATYESRPGQFYFVPAGTLHSIGSGNLVAEIQQTSDITYRVYDYGRLGIDGKPRQLHTDLAADAINYTFPNTPDPTALVVTDTRHGVVKSEHFTVDFIKLAAQADAAAADAKADGASAPEPYPVQHDGSSFRILMVTDGAIAIAPASGPAKTITRGNTALIPASITSFTLTGPGSALLIHC